MAWILLPSAFVRCLILSLLLLALPALASAAKKPAAPVAQTVVKVQVPHVPAPAIKAPRIVKGSTLTLSAPRPRSIATQGSLPRKGIIRALPQRSTRVVRVAREPLVTAPHALRSLGLQLEIHMMQESLR